MNKLGSVLFVVVQFIAGCVGQRVIYAVNAGGQSHVDSNGIKYLADPLTVGVSSDYGLRQQIKRVPQQDMALYQTERWHDQPFAYEVPIKEDGDYVLVLKFAEVYFYGPNLKVFNVRLNDHTVVSDLDIFAAVGHSTAHEEIVPLSVRKGKLSVAGQFSTFEGALKVELTKGAADNPKICAFYVMEGGVEDVPSLGDLDTPPTGGSEEAAEEDQEEPQRKSKFKSGPPAANPYAEDGSSLVVPIAVAFALFIPTLLCLCRL